MSAPRSEPSPHPIDVEVGRAVRAHRKARGWSQERLATTIGVSFQQLQKYERGSNRISASKLADIAETLETPIAALFGSASKILGESGLSSDQMRVADLFGKLPASSQRVIRSLVELMAQPASEAVVVELRRSAIPRN